MLQKFGKGTSTLSGDEAAEDAAFAAMFAARKRVFVDLLGWDVPVLADRYEIDQYDGAHARYLILTDRTGAHIASTRLLQTTRPHILKDLYADLCADDVPTGPDIAEITRFCLDRRLRAGERREARNRLISALVDDALANDIHRYTGVAEMAWLQQILAFGWVCRPLGLPQPIGGRLIGAIEIEITPDTPVLLAHAGIYRTGTQAGEIRHAA